MKKSLIFAFSLILTFAWSGGARAGVSEMDNDSSMKIHHVHTLLGHAMGMIIEGSALIMNAQMQMAPGYDEMDARRGYINLETGRSLIQGALSGDDMIAMHEAGLEDHADMKNVHRLGRAILDYIEIVEKMQIEVMNEGILDMHHMHMLVNHALSKMANGFNLVTLGNMGMAGDLDDFTVTHGRLMMDEADPIIATVIESQSMKDLHAAGRGPDGDIYMFETHRLIDKAREIINLLESS